MNQLVSICVVTYNSSSTILETLDSIRNQTYPEIELIISDDASKDDTVKVCRDWLVTNQDRFVSACIVETPQNTGISANCNRAFSKAGGDWIKVIAGDDCLGKDCISLNVEYTKAHPDTDILFSRICPFGDTSKISIYEKRFLYGYFHLSHRAFFYRLLIGNFLPAATSFIRRSAYLELGGFDESISFIEDWPFWIKAYVSGRKISFMNKTTVNYRMAETSISMNSKKSEAFNTSMAKATKYAENQISKTSLLLWIYVKTVYTGNNPVLKLLSYVIRVFNPVTYYLKYNDCKASSITDNLLLSDE